MTQEKAKEAHANVVRAMLAHLHVRISKHQRYIEVGERDLYGTRYTEVFVARVPVWRVESWWDNKGEFNLRSYPVVGDWEAL